MTWPTGNGVNINNWGPWEPPPTVGPPPAAANVAQSVPSPATFNAADGETSTEYFVSNLVTAAHDGVSFNTTAPIPPLNAAETTPSPPSGSSYEQQGPTAISNVASIQIAGLAQSAIQVFNFGSTGNV